MDILFTIFKHAQLHSYFMHILFACEITQFGEEACSSRVRQNVYLPFWVLILKIF